MYKPTEKQKEYMERHYQERIGKVYGDFKVVSIEYDWEEHAQYWEMECVRCGAIRRTKQGQDYVKGRNKGICKECKRRGIK